jgi:hypothetical protein
MQQQLTSDETVEAKHAFEVFSRSQGVTIKHYHADNGRFSDNAFLKDIKGAIPSQSITYCGVNAHFQNGIAEKRIRDLQEPARKQLLHAKARWPAAVTTNMWPYALGNTQHMRDSLPDSKDGTCPFEIFSGVEVALNLKSNHTFGCPVYALNSRLASGKTIPKWNPRARVGLYIGPSPRHARSVSLVLSLDTVLVSPQFHVQHDDFFETFSPNAGNPEILSHWQKLSGIRLDGKAEKVMARVSRGSKPTSKDNRVEPEPSLEPELFELEQEVPPQILEEEEIHHVETDTEPETDIPFGPTLRRSTRTRRLMARYQQYMEQRNMAFAAELSEVANVDESYYDVLHEDDYRIQDDMKDPVALMSPTDEDKMYYDQAMRSPDKQNFIEAIVKEVNDHITSKHWILIPRSKVPKGVKLLDSVWSMKRKRDIKTRKVYKHKARLNVHGGQQELAVVFFETFSPVVN